jgi:phosphoadenosine phosphosulfate reductase
MERVAEKLNEDLKGLNPQEIVKLLLEEYPGKVILGSSLGAEDQVLTDMLAKNGGKFTVFTLDTGRIFPETYEVIDETNKKYGFSIQVFFPDREQVENMVNSKGINLFYESVENRKACCHVRKVVPLKRALSGNTIWITGLRKDQSLVRFSTKLVEWDEGNQIIKVNPLLSWTEKQVWKYIKENDVPYNKLHDQGFPSIGCQPCTRAIKPGEDFRAGRWWWEAPEHSECGLHVKEEKKSM